MTEAGITALYLKSKSVLLPFPVPRLSPVTERVAVATEPRRFIFSASAYLSSVVGLAYGIPPKNTPSPSETLPKVISFQCLVE